MISSNSQPVMKFMKNIINHSTCVIALSLKDVPMYSQDVSKALFINDSISILNTSYQFSLNEGIGWLNVKLPSKL